MNELLHEIEDDIRQEKFDRLWQGLGKIMVGISVAVVLATIVVVVMQNHKQSVAMEQTDQFIRGMSDFTAQDYKGAVAEFASLSASAGSAYYGMAMLRTAQAQEKSNDNKTAAETYQALAAHGGIFGDLAAMRIDGAIQPDRHSPFYFTQSEWAGWQLLKAGKKTEAVAQFSALRDDADAPYSLRQRMRDVVGAMSDEQMNDEKKGKP
jgi:hypothetical protein